jgi:tetratricopeptide (TPR) repeat protein
MIKIKKNSNYIIFVYSLLLTNFLYAQNSKNCDNIYSKAGALIYSNPDKVIKIGESIVNESGNNVDCEIKGYKLICDAYTSKRNYEKTLEYLNKATGLLRLSNNALLKIAILNKQGIIYHQLKIYDKAIQYLDQAEQAIMEYPIKDSIHNDLGKNFIVRGFIYKEKFNCEIAINFFDRGILELSNVKSKSAYNIISIAKYNKGNCFILLNNNQLAIENFNQSYLAAKILDAKSLQAFANKGIAQVYTLEGNYDGAITKLNEALLLSNEVKDLVLNQEIYKGLSENYLATSQWEKFNIYHSKYQSIQKLIKESERKSISESLDLKKIEITKKLTEETSKINLYLLTLFLGLLLLVFFFSILIKKKRKDIVLIKSKINLLQLKKMK